MNLTPQEQAEVEEGLGYRRDADPELFDFVVRNLPAKGWAGEMSPGERRARKVIVQAAQNAAHGASQS